MARVCQTCKNYKPVYAPFVKHGIPLVMTCVKVADDLNEDGRCKYWESKKEKDN